MFGQGFPLVEPDFGPGGVFVLGGVVDCVVVEVVAAVLCVVGEADALAMPAAAPPVASAPATIVAPSILEIVIGSSLLGRLLVCERIVAGAAKSQGSGA
ncbi:MAG TPA: hypothetical protein VK778_15885 [Solirubrobacteraceae bacterium]|jgi:hypothetical protein|nr:hypothetical protein [Solirubrobacteraceae bacterium]